MLRPSLQMTVSLPTLALFLCVSLPAFSGDPFFIENKGQFPDEVLFQAPLPEARLWITESGHVHHVLSGDESYAVHVTVEAPGETDSCARGVDTLESYSSYFLGRHRSQWVPNARHFARAEHALTDDVELLYRTHEGNLEYDVLLAAGVDPEGVRLHFDGAEELVIQDDGELHVHTPVGVIREQAPVIFQQRSGKTHTVTGRFRLIDSETIGFEVDDYDPSLPLVIDPVLEYSTFLGGRDSDGSGDSFPGSLVVGDDGDVYVVGSSVSTDFPFESGYQDENVGSSDVTVSRLRPDGEGDDDLVFSTYLGGDASDTAYGIDLDSDGNIFVTGQTKSEDFPITSGVFDDEWTADDDSEAFVTRLNPDGDDLDYSTFVGGDAVDRSVGVKAYEEDGGTTAYITGFTYSEDFPVTEGAYDEEKSAEFCAIPAAVDIFVVKLSAKADEVLYGTYLGGEGFDTTYGLDVDADGDVYIVGGLGSDDEVETKASEEDPLERRPYDTTFSGADACIYVEGFVAKFSPNNEGDDDLVYLTYLGGGDEPEDTGGGGEYVFAIRVDDDEKALVVGRTPATDFPTKNPLPDDEGGEAQSGKDAAVVALLNPYGTDVDFATYLTAANPDVEDPMIEWSYGAAVDSEGGIWVAGQTPSTEFPVTDDALQSTHGDADNSGEGDGENDLFLARMLFDADSVKLSLDYLTYLGGDGPDCQFGFALTEEDEIFLGGITSSRDFPVTEDCYQDEHNGVTDLFVARVTTREREFIRGDMDITGSANILDPILVLVYLFGEGATMFCFDGADANDDGFVNLADPIYMLFAFYADGDDIPAPHPDCGTDPTEDDLGCEESYCD